MTVVRLLSALMLSCVAVNGCFNLTASTPCVLGLANLPGPSVQHNLAGPNECHPSGGKCIPQA
jgi:hypothetical protein